MTTDQEKARKIASEHAILRHAIRDMRAEIERLRQETGEHPVGDLGSMLRDFGKHLSLHFKLEEEDGYLGKQTSLAAGAQRKAEELLGQHQGLGERLARLLDGVERAEQGGTTLSDSFTQGLNDFLEEILHHESAENEFVQRLVLQDVGEGD